MDFNNYDGDSEEELYPHQSKTTKRIKYTFRYILYGISALVWGGILFILLSSCDPGLLDAMIFSDEAREIAQKDPDSFTVYKLQPIDYMNYNGSVQIKNIYYAEKVDEIDLCVKFNIDKISHGKLNDALVYILTDSNGNYYPVVNIMTDSNRKYGYARVSFDNVVLDLEKNKYYNYTTSHDWVSEIDKKFNGNNESNNLDISIDETEDKGVTYTLSVYSYDEIVKKDYAYVNNGILNIDYKAFTYAQNEESIKYDPINTITSHEIFSNVTYYSIEDYKE
ncbi:MAG: hypothetical protein A2Y15_03855 [Clostridiales bacterium GWF2_36_10]|nr:MAG: hypothetical protein A2Y15_03855 [Clostridiales bacterium GWF2_36_10]HAN21207.1 hypothetical protein [Clostridiales bacterium]